MTQPGLKQLSAWLKYQKRYGMDDAIDRVDRMHLADVCKPEYNLVDIGCNDGYISILVSPLVKEDKLKNKFDVLLSLAVSIQLRDFGDLSEQEIVDGYASLLVPSGIVVHETQKLQDRPNNQEHTKLMLDAFATKFEIIKHGQARSSGGREYYHLRKK